MGENRAVSIKNIIRADSEKGLAFLGAPMSINKSKSDPQVLNVNQEGTGEKTNIARTRGGTSKKHQINS